MNNRLPREFFARDTLTVAKELLGKKIVFNNHEAIIYETEAYVGVGDPACHAARGRTKRTEVMFSQAGISYVYLIYGMYHCLNFITEKVDFPAGVLIRGVYIPTHDITLNGPGKLCRHLGIDLTHNKTDIIKSPNFYVVDEGLSLKRYLSTPRIGITKGTDKLWRFVAKLSL